MAYEVTLAPGEEAKVNIAMNLSEKAQPFHFAVTNQAIYLPRIKLIAKTDPFYFQRVPLDQITHVAVMRLRPYALWLLAAAMIVGGFISCYCMIEPLLSDPGGKHEISGAPIAVFVCGFLVPFAARGRFGLQIWFNGGKFRWKPPLVVDKASKERIAEMYHGLIVALRQLGVSVSDKRPT